MSDHVRIRTFKSGTKCEHCQHIEPEYWVAQFASAYANCQTAVGRTRRAAIRKLLAAAKRGAK